VDRDLPRQRLRESLAFHRSEAREFKGDWPRYIEVWCDATGFDPNDHGDWMALEWASELPECFDRWIALLDAAIEAEEGAEARRTQ
jgi:hypothetical protein